VLIYPHAASLDGPFADFDLFLDNWNYFAFGGALLRDGPFRFAFSCLLEVSLADF